jgi:penicillin amidase
MRRFFAAFLIAITMGLVYLLDKSPMPGIPAIGRLLNPINGCWANAEPVNKNFSADLKLPVNSNATVWYDKRLVPHIHADNDHDLYFLEGYVHASFRLWQMDMETRAAGGRVSEVVGSKALEYDRKQRRKGMVYAAENSLRAMESEPRTKAMMDAYTEGINQYIASLSFKDYPIEYKLIGFAPEKWTNLRTALLMKYMADDLTGGTDDLALTYLRDRLPKEEFDLLYPERIAGATPVIPAGTVFDKPSLTIPAAPPDSVAFPHFDAADFGEKKEDGKGSNNWAISGSRTASGAAILCNDPHLGLNLPSLWYEVQLQAPNINVYGASLPGAPGVIIGFNDSLTWGLTNNYRDVKDFYLIKPVADNKNKYWFAGKQLDFNKRVEVIKVKGQPDVVDTIDYTIHGPVTYAAQNAKDGGLKKPLAMCWMGHRATNEMLAVYLLNRARNYNQFVDAIMNFQCPAQNMAYADRVGNIALWGQGQFVNQWKDQGRFVMNGSDSSTLWGQLIPMRENPHVLNPAQGYVASANQVTTDSTYPYNYTNSGWVNLRAWRINHLLSTIQKATIADMKTMQNDTYSELAAGTLPIMLKNIRNTSGNKYFETLRKWDYQLSAESEAASFYQIWWNLFFKDRWSEKLKHVPDDHYPLQERTMQLMSSIEHPVYDLKTTDQGRQTNAIENSFKQAVDSIGKLERTVGSDWYKVKNTSVTHLAKLPAFSYDHLKIGGWGNTINAAKGDHGPSWRMIVQMGKEIEAYGVYPGGQSGNPGSKYYADFLQQWVEGKYNKLEFFSNSDKQSDSAVKYVWTVKGAKG